MKSILILSDYSDCALNAIKFAADLSRKFDARIHVTHIHQIVVPGDIAFNINTYVQISSKEKEIFKTYIKKLSQQDFMKGIKLQSSLDTVYQLYDVLVMDKYDDIDMIVMGSNGVDGIKEFFIGSNTQKFIQLAHCPVIVIKDEVKVSNIKSIVFASDFKQEVIPKFHVIRDFAQKIGAKLHYLKIMTPKDYSVEDKEMNDIADFVKSTGINANDVSLYQSVSVEQGIIKYCKETKANMIAIETHGRTGFSHLIKDNIAESLSNHILIPMFSVRIDEEAGALSDGIVEFLIRKNLIIKKQSYG
ncbi:MAG: universal stress protein [Flavobacteriales bacterium]|nr:universal stress protein [Flavobacteriales bacterium]